MKTKIGQIRNYKEFFSLSRFFIFHIFFYVSRVSSFNFTFLPLLNLVFSFSFFHHHHHQLRLFLRSFFCPHLCLAENSWPFLERCVAHPQIWSQNYQALLISYFSLVCFCSRHLTEHAVALFCSDCHNTNYPSNGALFLLSAKKI